MSWLLVILFLNLTFGFPSEAGHDKKLPSAVVVGTVYCDTCFQQDFSMGSHFISGASVAVECKDGRFKKEVKTNKHGEFKVELPFSVSKHVKRIKECSVKLVSSSEPYCAVASSATSSSLLLKSRKQGLHIFSAGFFSFKPLKQPNLCNQKPTSVHNVKALFPPIPNIDPSSFPPPIQDPNTPGAAGNALLPPILPALPGLPQLPLLPPLPPLPGIPIPTETSSNNAESSHHNVADTKTFNLPPNPFQPPPLIPNPLQPPTPSTTPTPPLIPDNPFQPPPSSSPPLFPFPSVPPPSFPFPFPPPSIPGTPPASSSAKAASSP